MPRAATDPAIRAVFRRPFAEQVAFFRGKLGNLVPTATWRDVWRSQHDRAFMVAGAAKADLLADLAAAVDKAIADGESLDAFRRRFDEIVARHGWRGWTGDGTQAGRASRTRVIYRTNAATSYAAGRRAQLASFPVWVYRHGGSRDPRPQHLAWDGLTLPADHPFWQTHSPPNGWGCSCYVVGARSEEAARRLGGDPGKSLPDDWDERDRRGRLRGIDEGWDYAPGASVVCRGARNAAGDDDRRCVDFSMVETMAQKAAELAHQLGAALLASVVGKDFPVWWAQPTRAFPLARLPDADAETLGARPGVRVAYLSAETAAKQRREHPELAAPEYAAAQAVIDRHTHKVRDGTSLIYIRELPAGETGGHVMVVKATRSGGGLFVTSLRRLSRRQAERDAEVRRLLKRGDER